MIINQKYLKQYSPLPLNYDLTDIMIYVPVATEIWVRPLIGDDLTDEIEEQVENNTLSDENATLLTDGLLWQYLSFATCLEALPICWSRFSEVGVTKGKSENSDSLSLKDMTYVEQHLRKQVEFLKDSVKKWLCQHSESFPALDCCQCGCSCCEQAQLHKPNKWLQLYGTCRPNVDLK